MTVVDSLLDAARIVEYFRGKCVLVTGSTGFLGKILVEKILRVQPRVGKIYLVVRAIDEPSAKQRVQQEVIDTELFDLLREKHGKGFQQLVEEKIVALAGDMRRDGLGLEAAVLDTLARDTDVIVNIAATTNFYERYDVSLDVNVVGVKHLCTLAKRCARLKLLMHVSTAFVSGFREGLILERPIRPGESLREGGGAGAGAYYLDVDAELRLAKEVKKKSLQQQAERKAMKELGLQRARHFGWSNTYVFTKAMGEAVLAQHHQQQQLLRVAVPVVVMRPSIITSVLRDPAPGWMQGTRTIDSIIIGYARQNLSCFLADLGLAMDVIPADMVVNAMMAAAVAHSGSGEAQAVYVYHATSSLRNPATYGVLYQSGRRHFYENPRVGRDGRAIPTREMYFFTTVATFRLYMVLTYKIPLEVMHLLNLLLCGLFSRLYKDLHRKYKFAMHLVDVYGPFALFKGCFDDMNLERLRLSMAMNTPEDQMFNFDPKTIDWDDYFYRIHIPGILKYVCK